MAVKATELETELIDAVCARVRERLPAIRRAPANRSCASTTTGSRAEDLAEREHARPLRRGARALAARAAPRRRARSRSTSTTRTSSSTAGSSPHTIVEIVTDDMPFLVDSVTMELAPAGVPASHLVIHPVIRVRRDADGQPARRARADGAEAADAVAESVLHAEVDREPDRALLGRARAQRRARARRGRTPPSRTGSRCAARAETLIGELERSRRPRSIAPRSRGGAERSCNGSTDDHFTFLGYREYELVARWRARPGCRPCPDSGLGILRGAPGDAVHEAPPQRARRSARSPHALVLTKANSRSTVHRPAYLDYIGVKRFDADGRVIGERRFLGLYTTAAYKRARARSRSSAARSTTCSSAPASRRTATTQGATGDPRVLSARLAVPDRAATSCSRSRWGSSRSASASGVRLFVRRDPLDRFVACLVCIPRDRFNTENRERVAADPRRGVRRHPRRLDAAALRVGARAGPLHRPLPGRGARRRTTSPSSRPGSSRRRGRGATTCATR